MDGTLVFDARGDTNPVHDSRGFSADCNHGTIKKGNKILVRPLDAHLAGDWLNFVIDFEENTFTLYRNGVFQAKVRDHIPEGDVFMICLPDTAQDKFYIEEELDEAMYEDSDHD